MDYGKFRFEQAKREKEARKNQHVVEIKEIRMSPGIDVGDFNTKLTQRPEVPGRWQPGEGHRPLPRPRDGAHRHRRETCSSSFAEQCAEIANMDKSPKLEGRHMSMFLVSQGIQGAEVKYR